MYAFFFSSTDTAAAPNRYYRCPSQLTFLEQVKPLLLVLVEPVLVGHAAEDQAHPANGLRFGGSTLSSLPVLVGGRGCARRRMRARPEQQQ